MNGVTVLLTGKKEASQSFEGELFVYFGALFWEFSHVGEYIKNVGRVLGLVLKKTWEKL